MAKVTLSKERWFVTADKQRVVREDSPEAAFLLVAKGSAISPEVAAHYGIETYTGDSVERVSETVGDAGDRHVPVKSDKLAENHATMLIHQEVRERTATAEPNRNAGRQAAMMGDGIVNALRDEGNLVRIGEMPETEQGGTAEPTERTKEITPPQPELGKPTETPGGGGKPQSGQAGEHTLKDLQELEDARDKTLKG